MVQLQALEAIEGFDCDFSSDCCWHMTGAPTPQTIKTAVIHKAPINKAFYVRTFRMSTRRSPPELSYLQLSANSNSEAIWESCELCSKSGYVEVSFRHWQSPTAQLQLCWSAWKSIDEEDTDDDGYCMTIDPYTQFNSAPFIVNVRRGRPVMLSFRVKNRSTNGRTPAIVLIDFIEVSTQTCPLNVQTIPLETTTMQQFSPKINEYNNTATTQNIELLSFSGPLHIPSPLSQQITKRFETTSNKSLPSSEELQPGRAAGLSKKKGNLPAVVFGEKTAVDFGSSFSQVPVAKNPFIELFGEDFAEFLDPNFNTTRFEISNEVGEEERTSLQSPYACMTSGGCLFEKSTCGYTNSKVLSTKAAFQRVKVGDAHFAESRIDPGEVAVFETEVEMPDTPHNILFDHLEWSERASAGKVNLWQKGSEKLSACCFVRNRQPFELSCPFESTLMEHSQAGWQPGRILCPQGTSKIMFICENYGSGRGVCAVDNIRVHRKDDAEFLELCQREILAQS
ncbi:hypothetical protein DdX_19600 [Ditylenchus destructor]|uniref:MAM domain-containing protein n=1 Tax=Ditylenchus destructor TaxID=166010 RepID=A0AAD4QU42_9BILA|nr:hypothetical protein DdX_19600 [Ditylenchus destructor]